MNQKFLLEWLRYWASDPNFSHSFYFIAMSQNSKIMGFRNTSPEVEIPELSTNFDQQSFCEDHRSYSTIRTRIKTKISWFK
jgi:hypothetical protein